MWYNNIVVDKLHNIERRKKAKERSSKDAPTMISCLTNLWVGLHCAQPSGTSVREPAKNWFDVLDVVREDVPGNVENYVRGIHETFSLFHPEKQFSG